MAARLEAEGHSVLAGAPWAEITVTGRDVALAGTTDTDQSRDEAIMLLASVAGVQNVTSAVEIAPLANPFILEITAKDGALSLSGSVPNSAQLKALRELSGIAEADLEVRSGQMDPKGWRSAVDYALEQVADIGNGNLRLTDTTLDVHGSARSQRAYGDLLAAMADLPETVTRGDIDVLPVRAAPYTWTASYDGQGISISGHVPDETLIERLRTAEVSGTPVATGVALASGAPDGFADLSKLLVEQLALLDRGEATIIDGVSRLTGDPPTIEVAQAVENALSSSGSIVQLSPPRIGDYWLSINRQPSGLLVFDGYVPDEATRTHFAEQGEVDLNFLKFGSGQPDTYLVAADFGLDLLSRLAEGRFSLRGTVVSLTGKAATPDDFDAILTATTAGLPQGLTLGEFDVAPPTALEYTFAATRSVDGATVLSGFLPTPALEQLLLGEAGAQALSDVTFASGEPAGFAAAASRALDFLPWLEEGEVRFDGTGWTISGTPASDLDRASIETEYAVQDLAQAGWYLELTEPEPFEVAETDVPPAPDVAQPYSFTATKAGDAVTLAGNVPAPSTARYLETLAGVDGQLLTVAVGTPEAFVPHVQTGLRALLRLQTGTLSLADGAWSLEGQAVSAEDVTSIEADLAAVSPDWSTSLTAPSSLALCADRVAELSAHNAILFQSGAAIIAASATAELDRFAEALALCPDTVIEIEGHTDSDGDDRQNLALSVARAEAVSNALIERGVDPGRLYAIGYGAAQPIADNDTAEGKARNRRIVVTVRDPGSDD